MSASSRNLALALALALFAAASVQAEPDHANYTGLIVDARGLAVQRAMAPSLVAKSGTIIFPVVDREHPFDLDFALSEGLAVYAQSIEEAWKLKRLGGRPLVVKAAFVEEGTDFILDEQSVQGIFEADYSAKFLEKSAVAIVY